MPVSDKQHHGLESRTLRIEVTLGIVGVPLLAWVGWVSLTLFSLKGDTQAIKQKLADGGIGSIVSTLQNPNSPQQLVRAKLGLVSSQVQVARIEGKKPEVEKLAQLSSAVRAAAIRNPEIPEVWQAASELVSYRSQSQAEPLPKDLPNCLNTIVPGANWDEIRGPNGIVKVPGFSETPSTIPWMSHVTLGHCELNLDDDGHFDETPVGQFFSEVRKRHPNVALLSLILDDARIVYSGGKLLPVTELQFTNCVFDFRSPYLIPPKKGQALTDQLLIADLTAGSVKLPPTT
jgi:hypothetical protein